MALVFGISPGGKGSFGVVSLFWSGQLPASLIVARTVSSVAEAMDDLVGTVGEWGELSAVAIAAPLTSSGAPQGWRAIDKQLRKRVPEWAPRTWVRAPYTMPGAISVQGVALTWALANEIRHGTLPRHSVVETNPRLSLAAIAPDLQQAVLAYGDKRQSAATRAEAIATLTTRFIEAGILRLEADPPASAAGLDALVAAVTALAVAVPDAGLVAREHTGGDLRPVGRRPVVLLEALP